MTENLKLFMVLVGCTPQGRVIEQHDIFFGVGSSLRDLLPQLYTFWPEAKATYHIDAWREVTVVENYSIEIVPKSDGESCGQNLYFLNLGGYKPGDFEEYHYKLLTISPNLTTAIKISKKTAFYKHTGFKGAATHIDEKYGIDVDDSHDVLDLLNSDTRLQFQIKITALAQAKDEDELHLGYLKLKKN